jgi:predicted small secreted protein
MKKLSVAVLIAALSSAALLSACNTTEGVGKDVKSAGKAVEDTARDAKN